ncbi:MAG: hypothetical protein U0X75_20655 [Acidobacteriota bacterium]
MRIWDDRKTIFNRLTTEADQVEFSASSDSRCLFRQSFSATNTAKMIFDNRITAVGVQENNALRFRFATRDAKVWSYALKSDFAGLDGQSGKFTAVPPPVERTKQTIQNPSALVD